MASKIEETRIKLPETSKRTITPKDFCDQKGCPFYNNTTAAIAFSNEYLNTEFPMPCLLCKHRKELDIPREILKAKLEK